MVRSPIAVMWIPEPVYGFEQSLCVKNGGTDLLAKLTLFLTLTMCLLVTSFVFPQSWVHFQGLFSVFNSSQSKHFSLRVLVIEF